MAQPAGLTGRVSQSIHIKLAVEKLQLTIDEFRQKMKGEKVLTDQAEQKLIDCISALKNTPYKTDQDLPTSTISTIDDIKEKSSRIQKYIQDWNKLNVVTRNLSGGKIKSKILELIQSISSSTRLIETVSQMPLNVPATQQTVRAETDADISIEIQSTMDKFLIQELRHLEEKFESYSRALVQQAQAQSALQSKSEANPIQIPVLADIKKQQKQNSEAQEAQANENTNTENKNQIIQSQVTNQETSTAQKACIDAFCMLEGHGIEPNIDDATFWFEKARNLGEAKATFTLGLIKEKGIGTRVNKSKAQELFRKAAEMNDPSAQVKVALQMLSTLEMPLTSENEASGTKSPIAISGSIAIVNERAKMAIKLLKIAAETGHTEANTVLGRIYETGGFEDQHSGKFHQILKINLEKAVSCYQISASQEDDQALNFLGAHAYNITHNEEEAVQYFRKASQSGNCARALNNLALCFENGVGSCQQDLETALQLYQKSARMDYAPAMFNKAYLLFKMSKQAVNKLEEEEFLFESVHWLRMCLDHCDFIPDAHFLMGYFYEKGTQVDQSLIQAFTHYEKASTLGHVKAMTKLGHFYYSGIQKNITNSENPQTIQSYRTIVDYWLEPDRDLALKKYIRAGRRGDTEAYNCAGLIAESKNPVEAVNCYKLALALDPNNTNAMFNMALLYYTNLQEKEWHKEAIELMHKAAKKGNIKARQYLEDQSLIEKPKQVEDQQSETQQNGDDELISFKITQSVNFGDTKMSYLQGGGTTFDLTKSYGSLGSGGVFVQTNSGKTLKANQSIKTKKLEVVSETILNSDSADEQESLNDRIEMSVDYRY